jgi:D-glycero-D-manno-heptose 1,7-bisphosphate phosphatase
MRNRAVFLDRDGVLNTRMPPHMYVASPQQLKLMSHVPEALLSLQQAGWLLVVVTNQQGVGTGVMSAEQLEDVHAALRARLARYGITPLHIYACTHTADDLCMCRKPKPGLILQAAHQLDIAVPQSVLVGDAGTDMEAGRSAGCGAVVRVSRRGEQPDDTAHYHCGGLLEAARWILQGGLDRVRIG